MNIPTPEKKKIVAEAVIDRAAKLLQELWEEEEDRIIKGTDPTRVPNGILKAKKGKYC